MMNMTTMRDTREVMRDEMVMQGRILSLLEDGGMTIPEMAGKLKKPTREMMLWVMGMRRFGLLIEKGRPDEDGYFMYEKITAQA